MLPPPRNFTKPADVRSPEGRSTSVGAGGRCAEIPSGLRRIANIADTVLCVSEIKQKTFVEVNEGDTEEAAVTVGLVTIGASSFESPEPVRFFANRPFLFLIREKSTGVILFIGRMDDPIE